MVSFIYQSNRADNQSISIYIYSYVFLRSLQSVFDIGGSYGMGGRSNKCVLN